MGTSFVKYKGHGFWSWDGYLEHLFTLLAERIEGSEPEEWLRQACDHWRRQSSGDFGGWIHPDLDDYVTTKERRLSMVNHVQLLSRRIDLTREVRETMTMLIALLNEEIQTDESSPLDYMVTGPQPYKWRN